MRQVGRCSPSLNGPRTAIRLRLLIWQRNLGLIWPADVASLFASRA